MDNNVKVVLTSAATAAIMMAASLAMGFGKKPQPVYRVDGSEINITESLDALDNKVDGAITILSEAIKKGTKELRTDALQAIGREYKAKVAEMKAKMREEKTLRDAQRQDSREIYSRLQTATPQ